MSKTPPDSPYEPVSRRSLLNIALLSGVLWVVLGSIVIYFWQPLSLTEVLQAGDPFWQQLAAGLTTGAVFGYTASRLIQIPAYKKLSEDLPIVRVIRDAKLGTSDVLLISLVAGITEEWFFRAALQPLLGIGITSVLFVGIHGYFRFDSRHHIYFGGFMLLLSGVLGLLFAYVGIISAMVAHVVYDIWVMKDLRKPAA